MRKYVEIIPEVARKGQERFQFCFNLMQVCFVKFCAKPAVMKCSTCKFNHTNFRKFKVAVLLTTWTP